MTVVKIDCARIRSESTFHDVFAGGFGFPDFYGRNMDAWIDCMTYLDEPDAGMSKITVPKGECLTLHLENVADFARRTPQLFNTLTRCVAFVNYRRIENGGRSVLALSYRLETR